MTPDLLLTNLLLWSVQVLVVIGVCGPLPLLVRMRAPGPHLAFLQAVLLVCCLLPVLQPWDRQVIELPQAMARAVSARAVAADTADMVEDGLGWAAMALWIAAAGAGARLVMLAAGFARLRWLSRTAMRVDDPGALFAQLGARAEAVISSAVASPVTFGHLRPFILLPASFASLPAEAREAVLCHELIHVVRGDWIVVVLEEIAASILWFHPAVWWLRGRIRLAREQAVDRQVVQILGAREQYVQALVTVARGCSAVDLTPAAPFFRRRTLILRISAILQESNMSKKRVIVSLGACASAALFASWLVTTSLPLRAAPQVSIAAADQNVTVETGTLTLLHRPPLRYPAQLRAKQIRGTVTLELTVDTNGNVTDARVLSGPDELRKAALQAVLEWHYSRPGAPTRVQATLTFDPPPPLPPAKQVVREATGEATSPAQPRPKLLKVEYAVPEAVKLELEPIINEYVGQEVGVDTMGKLWAKVLEVEPHAAVSLRNETLEITLRDTPREAVVGPAAGGGVIGGIVGGVPARPPAPPRQIRVGGNVQAPKLINQPRAEYPPLARQARLQGVVRFNVTIGATGRVQHVELVSGHPLLVASAVAAVKQYEYQTTHLNGVPVEVVTVVEVPFTLDE